MTQEGIASIVKYQCNWMKHIGVQEIMQRRKQGRAEEVERVEGEQEFARCVGQQLREVNDQTIEHLIRAAHRRDHLHHDQKLDLLQVIACKSGVHLNKHLLLNHLSLHHLPRVTDLEENWHRSRKSYFLLKGALHIYEHRPQERQQLKFNTQPVNPYTLEDEDQKYLSLDEFRKCHPDYALLEEVEEFRGVGDLFGEGKPPGQARVKLVAVDAVVAVVGETEHEAETMVHDGIAHEDKLEILNYFPVLRVIGKRLNAFINSFKLKQFTLKELIYKHGEKPKSVYFLIRGQVSFELLLDDGPDPHSRPHPISTETLSEASYFGEEELVFKSDRVQSAKVVSSKCVVLELERDKFDKFMENPEFCELVTRAARLKRAERERKIERARQLLLEKTGVKGQEVMNETEARQLALTERADPKRRFSKRRCSQASVRLMHGHVVKQSPPKAETVHFSMLEVNPDMYEAAKKKFRKFHAKPLEYAAPQPRDFKKVWRILKLEEVLQEEEMELSAPEGRKFYESHRRLQQQVAEAHSLRPKTTASNYRTKLQYIAYLQQFNH